MKSLTSSSTRPSTTHKNQDERKPQIGIEKAKILLLSNSGNNLCFSNAFLNSILNLPVICDILTIGKGGQIFKELKRLFKFTGGISTTQQLREDVAKYYQAAGDYIIVQIAIP